jgi:SAM-dependent methyltransferase
MDQPGLDSAQHRHALRSLNRIHLMLGADRSLFRDLRRCADGCMESIVDVGVGGGGFLGYVDRKRQLSTRLVGLDISGFALQCARDWQDHAISCVQGSALRLPFAGGSLDWVVCSTLLHHFDQDDVVAILAECARVCRRGVLISDLTRSTLAWCCTWAVTRLVSRSPVFHSDGPSSVRAAYRCGELRALAAQAGLKGCRIRSRFPFRMILEWHKTDVAQS